MSEPVEITNVQWSGTVPQWANEKTLKQIEDYIKDHTKLSKTELKKVNKNLKELIKECKKGGSGSDTNGATRAASDLEDALSGLDRETRETSGSMGDLDESTEKVEKKQNKYSKALGKSTTFLAGSFMKIMGQVAGMFMNQVDGYDKIYKSGLALAGSQRDSVKGLAEFAKLAIDAKLPLADLAEVSLKYNKAVHKYGIKGFAKQLDTINTGLTGYGFTISESSEFLGQYLEQSRRLGFLEKLSQAQVRKAATQAALDTVKWSQALGKSREELEAQASDAKGRDDIKNFVRGIADPKLAKMVGGSIENLSKMIDDPKVLDTMLSIIASENPYANEELNNILRSGGVELRDQFLELRDAVRSGSLTQEEAEKRIASLAEASKKMDTGFLTLIGPAGDSVMGFRNSLLETQEQLVKGKTIEKDRISKSRAGLKNEMKRRVAVNDKIVGSALASTKAIDAITEALSSATDIMENNSAALEKTIKLTVDAIVVASSMLIEGISSAVSWLDSIFGEGGDFMDNMITMFDKLGEVIMLAIMTGLYKATKGKPWETANPKYYKSKIKEERMTEEKERRGNLKLPAIEDFAKLSSDKQSDLAIAAMERVNTLELKIKKMQKEADKEWFGASDTTEQRLQEARIKLKAMEELSGQYGEEYRFSKFGTPKNTSITTPSGQSNPVGKGGTPATPSPQASTNITPQQSNPATDQNVTASLNELNTLIKEGNELARKQIRVLQQTGPSLA